jgi:hypothetical protein
VLLIALFSYATPILQAFDYIQILAFTVFVPGSYTALVQKFLMILYRAFDFDYFSHLFSSERPMHASNGFEAQDFDA